MKGTKKTLTLLGLGISVMLAAVLAAACSPEKEQTYTAVTEPTYPPFESTNDDGDLVGFDIDLINAIADDQNFKVTMKTLSFDSLIPAVEAGNADLIIAGMSQNKDRLKHVDFSDGYYESGNYYMVKKDSSYNSESDLPSDAVVACQPGTTTAEYVQKLVDQGKIGKVTLIDSYTTCVLQLQNGDIDAVAGDKPVLDEYISKYPDKYKLAGKVSTETGDGLMRIAVAKNNDELKEKINDGLENIIENGTYKKLCKKWNIKGLSEDVSDDD